MTENYHPIQGIEVGKNGRAKFKQNEIVCLLMESSALNLKLITRLTNEVEK